MLVFAGRIAFVEMFFITIFSMPISTRDA